MTTFTAPQPTPYAPTAEQRSSLGINGLVALVIAFVIVVTLVVTGGDAAADSPASSGEASVDSIEVYIVQPGDTLWAIAAERALPGDDVQSLVNVLNEQAGSASLEVGQRIVIDHRELR